MLTIELGRAGSGRVRSHLGAVFGTRGRTTGRKRGEYGRQGENGVRRSRTVLFYFFKKKTTTGKAFFSITLFRCWLVMHAIFPGSSRGGSEWMMSEWVGVSAIAKELMYCYSSPLADSTE